MIFVSAYLLEIVVLASYNDYTTYAVGNIFRTLGSEIIIFILSISLMSLRSATECLPWDLPASRQ